MPHTGHSLSHGAGRRSLVLARGLGRRYGVTRLSTGIRPRVSFKYSSTLNGQLSNSSKNLDSIATMCAMIGLRGGKHMSLMKRISAEFLGTFWLVLAAVAPQFWRPHSRNWVSDSWEWRWFWSDGHDHGVRHRPHFRMPFESRSHHRPGGGQAFPWSNVLAYIAVQVLGAIVASGVLYAIASGKPGFSPGGFAANGYGDHSPAFTPWNRRSWPSACSLSCS